VRWIQDMSWIQTYTGKCFHPREPGPDDFDIRDVAHALSLLCRFNGHCRTFYSVAEHSVRVSRICPPAAALWGLLHDLGEAYVGDLPRPLKPLMPRFEEIEATVRSADEIAADLGPLGFQAQPFEFDSQQNGLVESAVIGLERTVETSTLILRAVGDIFAGLFSGSGEAIEDVAGPVGMVGDHF